MADIQISYGTSVAGTGLINGLATSSTWTAGYEWYAWDNTGDLALDRLQQGKITVGTSPTANTEIRLYAVGCDGVSWPDVFDGTPSAETVTSEGVRDSFAKLGAVLRVDATTSNREYPFHFSLAPLFGGVVPASGVVFVAHNTAVNLNATAGNHFYRDTPVHITSV